LFFSARDLLVLSYHHHAQDGDSDNQRDDPKIPFHGVPFSFFRLLLLPR
jgi:hypothetical protein